MSACKKARSLRDQRSGKGSLRRQAKTALGLLATCAALVACSPDHGLGPSTQGIRGTVHRTEACPDSILEIRVAAFNNYPVEAFTDLSGFSDSLSRCADSSFYEITLGPGTYPLIAVVCRTSASWGTDCVLGFYCSQDDPATPASISIPSGVTVENVDIWVDPEAGAIPFGGRATMFPSGSRPVESR